MRKNFILPAIENLNRIAASFVLTKCSVAKPFLLHLMGWALTLLVVFSVPHTTHAQEEDSIPPAFQQLADSIEKALTNHRVELSNLKVRVDQMESLEKTVENLIQASDSENIAHSELLLMPQPQITSLKYIRKKNLLTLKSLAELYEALQKQHDAGLILFNQNAERVKLAQKQIAELQESSLSDIQKKELEIIVRELIRVLREKKQLGDRYLQIHDDLKRQLKAAVDEKTAVGEKIAAQLETRIETSIFTATNHYRGIGNAMPAAVSSLGSRLNAVFSPSMWQIQWRRIKTGGFSPWAILGFWIGSILWLHVRFGSFLQRVEESLETPNRFHRGLGIFLLRRSLLFLGMTLLFGIYSSRDLPLLDIGPERVLYQTFLTLLLSRWGLDYLEHGFSSPTTALRSYAALQLNRLIRILRAYLIAGSLLMWAAGDGSLLIRLSIDILAVGLLVWTVVFWRRMTPVVTEGVRKGEAGPDQLRKNLVKGWSYLVSGGMLFLSVAGYNMLAGKWISSWIVTVALLFLGRIILNGLREWHRDLRDQAVATDEDPQIDSAHQLRRSLILLFEGVLYLCLARGLIAAWDYHDLLISRLNQLFDATFIIGSLNFSLKGILTAAVILFLTHLLVRIGCSVLRDMVLDKKPLERGFKDSVLTVSRYLGWGTGLLLALGTIGVNTTSMAVVFGALSVGIGFGLQTIFNNFISGLILLFERPIQVGDTIEINGMWAEVKKINVRATVVQTFDNASVIIPNSEFISQQVTNWSFKDSRMRRNLEVGVAYGSDIDLVEKTMLDIALDNQNVLRYPQPQVLFVDHAASALIFRLRIWVDLDNYWSVPHKVRREIDRRFRELNIEIAFPQQDVHLRTIPKEIRAANSSDGAVGNGSIDEKTSPE